MPDALQIPGLDNNTISLAVISYFIFLWGGMKEEETY